MIYINENKFLFINLKKKKGLLIINFFFDILFNVRYRAIRRNSKIKGIKIEAIIKCKRFNRIKAKKFRI